MKAMVLESPSPIESAPLKLRDLPVPRPEPGEILVRVSACGICRTDLHVIEGDLPQRKLPLIPGHQVVGRVESVGTRANRFRIGDRVGIAWLRGTCGHCQFCRRGDENLCESPRFTGYDENGGFAEYTVVPEAFAYPVPEAFGNEEATPLLCAGIIGYRALKRSELRSGGILGLLGFGSSAHIVLQLAKHRGNRVFVVTRGEGHREYARRMGAEWVGETIEGMPEKMDSAIIFAPAGELLPPALEALQKGGTLALAGIYMTEVPPLQYEKHLFYEKNIRSVTANTREDGKELLREAASVPVRPRITTYRLEDANRALLDLKSDRITGSGVLLIA